MSIKKELQQIIKSSLEKSNIELDPSKIIIEIPKDASHGNYSTNVALVLTKILHKNPMEIANLIKDNIETPIVSKIEIAAPGFINF